MGGIAGESISMSITGQRPPQMQQVRKKPAPKKVRPPQRGGVTVSPQRGNGKVAPSGAGADAKKKPKAPSAAPTPTVRERALAALQQPAEPLYSGLTMVRFNHYQKLFPVHNGVLQWRHVDEEYAFSYVYKGRFGRRLLLLNNPDSLGRPVPTPVPAPTPIGEAAGAAAGAAGAGTGAQEQEQYAQSDAECEYFIGLQPAQQYKVEVEEGAEGVGAEGLRLREGALTASVLSAAPPPCSGSGAGSGSNINGSNSNSNGNGKPPQPRAGNAAVQGITQQLLAMDVGDLHSDEAKRLREARDLEDVLFS